ncbi:MAG: hypothetical protein ACAI34_17435 [Verrucomicrobium sp.]|nr:hypothetical protein [Verrucomicrobium sp.]
MAPSAKSVVSADRAGLLTLQPFGQDICATWHEGEAEPAVPIHEGALEELRALENEGRVILLSAPRAGHGKTHLLGRVAERLQSEAVVASLPWQTEEGMTWPGCGRGILTDLAYSGVKPNLLQRVCAGVHATLLKRLIQTGRIPSTDPTQALRVLSQDPMNLFSETGPAKVIGEWFRKHYDHLHPSLTEVTYLEGRAEVGDWLRVMFDYVEHPSPATLSALAAGMDGTGPDQLARFLKLTVIWRPVVLVADHMDGLYRDADAGVAVARMSLVLTSLPGVRVVLSMNQDLWDTTFGRQLPSALEDRLNARNVSLAGLNAEEARELLKLRMAKMGVNEAQRADFLSYLDLDRYVLGRASGSISTRGMLRHAAQAWRKWLRSSPAEPSAKTNEPAGPADGDALPFIVEEPGPATQASAPIIESQPPLLPEFEEEPEEDLSLLARHLAEEQGGEVVNLASPAKASPGPTVPVWAPSPPSSFLPVAKEATSPASEAPSSPPVVAGAPSPTPAPPASPFAPYQAPTTAPAGNAEVVNPPSPPASSLPPAPISGGASPFQPAATQTETQSTPTSDSGENNFERLRQLLSKVRASSEMATLPDAASKTTAKVRITVPVQKDSGNKTRMMPSSAAAGVATASPLAPPSETPVASAPPPLGERFETLREQILGRDQMLRVYWPMIGTVIRVAGKKFPVVNYDEVELPGLAGRSLSRWRLQGTEIIFGLEDFADERYWKTVTSFVVGRVAELTAAANQVGQPAPQIKLLVFKGDMEAAALAGLLQHDVIPSALRTHLDVMHLDARSLASIYAMHQLLSESDPISGGVENHSVLSSLGSELEFFWKRVTRPLR